MEPYKKPYLILWSSLAVALDALEHMNYGQAHNILLQAQRDAEQAYLEQAKPEASLQKKPPTV